MRFLYTIGIMLYVAGIRIASLFNSKAAAWTRGRKGLRMRLESFRPLTENAKVAWFHCASLGEFEQGRPVIEEFRRRNPEWKIVLTFFSPSGYEIRKNHPGADAVFYLPPDTLRSVRHFIRCIRPNLAVFVKYEFWFNYLHSLDKNNIPVYVISAIFRPGQHFFRSIGAWPRKQLKKVDHFFVQDDSSAALLRSIGIGDITVSGDTRFDRVASVAGSASSFPAIEAFIAGRKVFLAGSTWPADEEKILALPGEFPDMAFIIAPHETGREHIESLERQFSKYPKVRYTEPGNTEINSRILIIDTIGILSQIYRYAHIAYVGGGFGAGIHNILEAAAFGKPVIFGPNYHKFREAKELTGEGGAFPVSDARELTTVTRMLLEDRDEYRKAADTSFRYVRSRTGATSMIVEKIGS